MLQIIITVIVLSSLIPFSYAQEDNKFTITTNRNFYENGDVIIVSGHVKPIMQNVPIIIQFIADGMLIDVAQIMIAQDGTFVHLLVADGPLWKKSGEYFIKASYGMQSIESGFEFTSSKKIGMETDVFEVDAGKYGTFDVKYDIIGGNVDYIHVEPEIFGIVIGIDSADNGKLVVELPRQYIDSTDENGVDDIFIILIDGVQVPYIEESNQNSHARKIFINFEKDDTTIEIIGTRVIPEFGSMTVMILAITIIATTITAKSKIFCSNFYR